MHTTDTQNLNKLKKGDFCLLCGGDPSIIGFFVPDNPQKFGAAKGKSIYFRYCLCSQCHGDPDTPEKVEKIIYAELFFGGAML